MAAVAECEVGDSHGEDAPATGVINGEEIGEETGDEVDMVDAGGVGIPRKSKNRS